MSESICRACETRGQPWLGDPPRCAFRRGSFDQDNWNCATMNRLRGHVEASAAYSNDQWAAVLPYLDKGSFLVLGWYKHHGSTEFALIINGAESHPLALMEAEDLMDSLGE